MLFTADVSRSRARGRPPHVSRPAARTRIVLSIALRLRVSRPRAPPPSRPPPRDRAQPRDPGPPALLAFRTDLAPARVSAAIGSYGAQITRSRPETVSMRSTEQRRNDRREGLLRGCLCHVRARRRALRFLEPHGRLQLQPDGARPSRGCRPRTAYIGALKAIIFEAISVTSSTADTGIIASAAAMLVSWRLDPSRAKPRTLRWCVRRARASTFSSAISERPCLRTAFLSRVGAGRCGRGLGGRLVDYRRSRTPFCNSATATGRSC